MNADDITRILDELQTRLDGPARYAFELVVRQVFAEGVLLLIGLLFLVGASVVLPRMIYLGWKSDYDDRVAQWNARNDHEKQYPTLYGKPSEGDPLLAALVLSVVGVFGVALAWVLGQEAILKVLNPEYAAIERIFRLVSP